MFNPDDKDLIVKIIKERGIGKSLIPLYVKIYNKTYTILELDDIEDFNMSAFRIGFGCVVGNFINDSFPIKYISEFEPITFTKVFDEKYNIDVMYSVYETSYVSYDDRVEEEDLGNVHYLLNMYFDSLSEYLSNRTKSIKAMKLKKLIEENK